MTDFKKTSMSYLDAALALQDHETVHLDCGPRCPVAKQLHDAMTGNMHAATSFAQTDDTAGQMRDNLRGTAGGDRSNDWRR